MITESVADVIPNERESRHISAIMRQTFTRFLPDTFTMLLVATVILASFLPIQGVPAEYFGPYGEVPFECDESILDTELEQCESMCHIDDIDALITDLQKLFDQSK